jgi:hypothetical protein
MANREPSRGIYADLAAKRASKYDVDLEKRVQAWIEGVSGITISGPFREGLMDGVVLCELINKIKPGTIAKIHRSSILMFRRENFGFFQNACLKLGCVSDETAVFEDVYEDRNMGQFLINIVALARHTQYQPGYTGPILADASKDATGTAPAPKTPPGGYIPTYEEEAQRVALEAKEASRYVEHGILSNPADNAYHGQKVTSPPATHAAAAPPPGKYIPTFTDAANDQALKAKTTGMYVEHGILMNPEDNLSHGQKK